MDAQGALEAAGWRLKSGNYKFPIEQKLFDMYVRMTGQTQPGKGIDAEGSGQLELEAGAQLSEASS